MQLLLWDVLKPMISSLLGQRASDLSRNRPLFKSPLATQQVVVVKPKPSARKRPARVDASAQPQPGTPATSPAGSPAALVESVPAPGMATTPRSPAAPRLSAQDRYDAVVKHLLVTHAIKVRRWRTAMSGVAWELTYRDGSVKRMIEAPYPKGPMSASIFLHEVGHHAIGFNRYKPRCLEEYHAWKWSLEAMEEHGLDITDAVRYRMALSLWYAVGKASRRGIKSLPPELAPFVNRPPKPAQKSDKQTGKKAGKASRQQRDVEGDQVEHEQAA